MALMTVPVLLASLLWTAGSPSAALAFASRGWTLGALVPILSQALGGIVVGQITKRLGGVSKGFAGVGGLTITGVVQSLEAGKMLANELCVALVLVVFRRGTCAHVPSRTSNYVYHRSIWLHARDPWQRQKAA